MFLNLKPTNQKGFIKLILMLAVVAAFGVIGYLIIVQSSTIMQQPIPIPLPPIKNQNIGIKLIDAFSGKVISNVDVKIYSDNGVRCIKAPCNTNGREWIGKSNIVGSIFIPMNVIDVVTTITATGYKSGKDLNNDSVKNNKNSWVLELDPDDKIDNAERLLKLIDSQTKKIITSTPLWLTNSQNCQPPECSVYTFNGITNSLGNIYIPISKVKKSSWVFINGYNPKQLPTNWINSILTLEKSEN